MKWCGWEKESYFFNHDKESTMCSENSLTAYMATRYQNPEEYLPESLHRENLKIYVAGT